MTNLAGAKQKISRASKHIEDLKNSAKSYLQGKGMWIHSEEQSNGDLVFRVKIPQAVPPELGAIVGDIVHNLRSALDLLAWQLVEKTVGQGQELRVSLSDI